MGSPRARITKTTEKNPLFNRDPKLAGTDQAKEGVRSRSPKGERRKFFKSFISHQKFGRNFICLKRVSSSQEFRRKISDPARRSKVLFHGKVLDQPKVRG